MSDKKKKKPTSKKTPAKSSGATKSKTSGYKTLKKEEQLQFTRLSVERTSDAIFWIGCDARILFVNDTACRYLGYTQKELLSKKLFDIDPNLSEENWESMWSRIKEIKISTMESNHISKENVSYPVEVNASYVEFSDKEYLIAYARPIKERKMAESALKESEGKFRMLSEQGLLAITIIQDNILKYVNNAFSEMTGYPITELLDMKAEEFAKLVHPDDRSFVMQQAKKKQANDEDVVANYAFRIISKNSTTKWVDLYSKTVVYNGYFADFVSLIDISERKKAEEILQKAHDELEFLVKERTVELTESNRQLKRRIFDLYTIFELSRNFNAVLNYETLLDSFVLTSLGQMGVAKAALYLPVKAGTIEFHLARVKGSPPFPKEEITIKPISEFGKYITAYNRPVYINEIKERLPRTELAFTDYFEDGLVVPLIFQTKLRGVLVLSGKESKAQFQDEDIEFLSILANQTAVSIENARLYESEKEAMDKLQETQKLLLQTERLAVLGELSAKIAHEINNPLGIIKNYLQLLMDKTKENPKASDNINIISLEIDRIATIVKQLLSMGRPMHMTFARIDMVAVLNEILSAMSEQFANASIKIDLKIVKPVPEIMAWSDGLKQIFMNLLMNSKYAIEHGGDIFITVRPLKYSVKMIFEDTGPGIKDKHIPHIFEPFYSTKGEGIGTGLGLSVSNTIVKNHNGTISFKNSKKGGQFTIELPIEQEEREYDWSI